MSPCRPAAARSSSDRSLGPFPYQVFEFFWFSLDATGWSVQSDEIDLSGAEVTVSADEENLPVLVAQLQAGYGSQYAISFTPQGWSAQRDTTYQVEILGVNPPISYEIVVVDCQE